jgi:glycosyltransferase involved in cell wall biosynthesis
MNILLLSEVSAEQVIGGAERVLREQAQALRNRGHEVTIVARAPSKQAALETSVSGLLEYRYPVTSGHELGFVLSSIRGALRCFDVATNRRPPQGIVVHQSLAGLGPVLARHLQGRFVYLCLSLAHEEYRSRNRRTGHAAHALRQALNAVGRRWTERLVIRRCARVIVLSDFMNRRVMSVHGIAPEKIRLVAGAVDVERFRPIANRTEIRRRLKLPPTQTILFTVRNLVPRMGLHNLLQAMSLLRRQDVGRDLLLLIGGEGPLGSDLTGQIRRLGLGDCVRLIGFVPDDSLPAHYQAADLTVLPTQELEGFGLITVEALACGTPVVGTPVGAIPEVLGRVDPDLIAAGCAAAPLAEAIGGLLKRFRLSPLEYKRLATKGRTLVEKEYTWGRHAEQIENLLQELDVPVGAHGLR